MDGRGSKKRVSASSRRGLRLEAKRLQRAAEHRLPDGLAGPGDLGLRDQSAHAVPNQHHPAEGRVGAAGVEGRSGSVEFAAQQPGAAEEVVARRIGEGPELIAGVEVRVGAEVVEHLREVEGRAAQAVDQHHGDLAGLVWLEDVQALALPELAGP